MTSLIALANDTATSYWIRRFFRFRRRPASVPRGLGLRCYSPAAPPLRLLVSSRNSKAVRRDTHTDRERGDLVCLILRFQNKGSNLKKSNCLT
jgi:hypothetical protein